MHVPACRISSTSLLAWPHNQRALTWPSLYEAAESSTHALPRFSNGDCGTSSWTLSFPALVPVASLQRLLNPKPALGTFCHGLKERHSISKQGNVTEGHRNSAVGVTAAKQNLSSTRTASTSSGHMAANQIQRVFLIWHSALSSNSLLRFPQPISSLPDVWFFKKYLTTCKKKSHNSLGADRQ